MDKNKKMVNILTILLLLILLLYWCFDGINRISNGVITFDDAYNAQVSKNIVDEGRYKVDYPSDQVFYNPITTGPTLLLPTAAVFSICGVSNFSTAIVPFCYSVGVIVLCFLVALFLVKKYPCGMFMAVVVTSAFVLSSTWLIYMSSYLLGEVGAMFFALLTVLMLLLSEHKNSKMKFIVYLFAGGFMAFGFVTKTSQIFMSIVLLMLLLIKAIVVKADSGKQFGAYVLGFILGIFVWDIYKATQFKDGFSGVRQWWIAEWQNMFGQTGSTGLFDNFSLEKVETRFLYLKEVICQEYFLIFVFMIVPLVLLLFYIFSRGEKLKEVSPIIFLGIMSDSLLVYYVLFGSDGLTYARRMAVYGELLVYSNILIMCYFLIFTINKHLKTMVAVVSVGCLIFCVSSTTIVSNNIVSLKNRDTISPQYTATLNIADFVKELPEDAMIFGYGWWQAPEVSLMSDREFIDVSTYYLNLDAINFENAYLVIGSIVQPPTWVWSGDFDSYIKQIFDVEIVYEDPRYPGEEFKVYRLKDISDNEEKVF